MRYDESPRLHISLFPTLATVTQLLAIEAYFPDSGFDRLATNGAL
jgi:hypothetical protein